MSSIGRFCVATYNVHKCQGFDRRIVPERIIAVLRELKADVLCLQEVVHAPEGLRVHDQASVIARALPEYTWHFGANRDLHGGTYGNMTLSRLPVLDWRNHDISKTGREPRGVLQTDVQVAGGHGVHVFNVHLGTGFMERRFQAERLVGDGILGQSGAERATTGARRLQRVDTRFDDSIAAVQLRNVSAAARAESAPHVSGDAPADDAGPLLLRASSEAAFDAGMAISEGAGRVRSSAAFGGICG